MKRRNNVLTIDLTNRRYTVEERPDLFNKYIGAAGVGDQVA